MHKLILYTRKGCCLCEGLETRLLRLPFEQLVPEVELFVIDIDSKEVSSYEKGLYDLKVPVMAIRPHELNQLVELPSVSPRLKDQGLMEWLQKAITKALGKLYNH